MRPGHRSLPDVLLRLNLIEVNDARLGGYRTAMAAERSAFMMHL